MSKEAPSMKAKYLETGNVEDIELPVVFRYGPQPTTRKWLHLTHPKDAGETPARAFFNPYFIVRDNSVAGPLRGKHLAAAVYDSKRFFEGVITEVTKADPYNPNFVQARKALGERVKKDAEHTEVAVLRKENARLEAQLKLTAAQQQGEETEAEEYQRKLKEATRELKKLNARYFQCPWCDREFKKGKIAKRQSGVVNHMKHCKKRPPNANEFQAIIDSAKDIRVPDSKEYGDPDLTEVPLGQLEAKRKDK